MYTSASSMNMFTRNIGPAYVHFTFLLCILFSHFTGSWLSAVQRNSGSGSGTHPRSDPTNQAETGTDIKATQREASAQGPPSHSPGTRTTSTTPYRPCSLSPAWAAKAGRCTCTARREAGARAARSSRPRPGAAGAGGGFEEGRRRSSVDTDSPTSRDLSTSYLPPAALSPHSHHYPSSSAHPTNTHNAISSSFSTFTHTSTSFANPSQHQSRQSSAYPIPPYQPHAPSLPSGSSGVGRGMAIRNAHIRPLAVAPFTPPSSVSPNSHGHSHRLSGRLAHAPTHAPASSSFAGAMNASLPLTPVSSNDTHAPAVSSCPCPSTTANRDPTPPHPVPADIPLIELVFPHQAAGICESAFPLHIVTPPSHVLDGFVVDPYSSSSSSSPPADRSTASYSPPDRIPSSSSSSFSFSPPRITQPTVAGSSRDETGNVNRNVPNSSVHMRVGVKERTALVRLPPPHASSARPETLSANFSDVLRPHDTARLASSSAFGISASRLHGALDIRESLTALLDLAGECLEAAYLVLILDKYERSEVEMRGLLHNLLYAGGVALAPAKSSDMGSGAASRSGHGQGQGQGQTQGQGVLGGWEWDSDRWVLVGLEL